MKHIPEPPKPPEIRRIHYPGFSKLEFYGFIAAVVIILACLLASCGARKVATDITSNKTVQDTKKYESVHREETNASKSTEAKTSLETNTSEGATTTNVKKYDAATGKLVEERTTVSNKKKSGTKQANETKYFEETQYHLVNMERTITTHVTVKEYSKSKKSDTNNKPLYWMLFGVGTICVLVWGGLKLLRQP